MTPLPTLYITGKLDYTTQSTVLVETFKLPLVAAPLVLSNLSH